MLDFPYTCQDIDKEIEYLKMNYGEEEYKDILADCIEAMENVRKTNEEMREVAERQLREKENKIEELNNEIKYLTRSLEDKIYK